MNTFQEKFKLLYVPYLVILIGFIGGYTLLHVLLGGGSQGHITNLILPAVLSWLPVLIGYRHRAKIIRYGYRYKDGFVFQLLLWFAVALPAVVAQYYMAAAMGKFVPFTDSLLPLNALFETAEASGLYLFLGALVLGAGLVYFLLFFVTLDPWEYMRYREGLAPTGEHELNFVVKFFVPAKGYLITPIVMDLNILVFLAMAVSGLGFADFRTGDLIHWGGNIRPLTMDGEWWRLLSCVFLHGGAKHLISNMIGLVFVGSLVEPVLGWRRFAFIYLIAGIVASAASMWWHVATVSVGASGAIFGLYGVFVALQLAGVFPKDFRRQFLRMTLVFIVYNVAMGFTGNIDNAAHLGGLACGVIAGFLVAPGIKASRKRARVIPLGTYEERTGTY